MWCAVLGCVQHENPSKLRLDVGWTRAGHGLERGHAYVGLSLTTYLLHWHAQCRQGAAFKPGVQLCHILLACPRSRLQSLRLLQHVRHYLTYTSLQTMAVPVSQGLPVHKASGHGWQQLHKATAQQHSAANNMISVGTNLHCQPGTVCIALCKIRSYMWHDKHSTNSCLLHRRFC